MLSNKKILRSALLVLLMLALLITSVYAWIYGGVTPTVTGNMRIGSTSGLVFEIDSEDRELIDLNKYLGISLENMILNEVSSSNGKDFVKRDTGHYFRESGNPAGGDEDAEEIITFISAEPNGGVVEGKGGDYVHADIKLSLEYAEAGTSYYIYFLNGALSSTDTVEYKTGFKKNVEDGVVTSLITENGLKALRASIRVENAKGYGPALDNDDHRMVFGNAAEIEGDGQTQAVVSTEEINLTDGGVIYPVQVAGTYYIDGVLTHCGELTDGMHVQSFDSCAINGKDGLVGEELPEENYLFCLDANYKSVSISLDIWLEGGSMYCRNSDVFIDDDVHFDMYFVAYQVKPAAEPVTEG